MTANLRSTRYLALAVLSTASFVTIFSNLVIIPVLPEIAEEFDVSIALGGLLATSYALIAAVGSLLIGPTIDRLGRRPVILICLFLFAVANALSAISPNFWVLVASRALSGVGAAGLMSAVFAAVADYFPYNERGKATAMVFTANTTAPIIALPISAVLADFVTWRLNFGFLGVVSLLSMLIVWTRLPDEEREKMEGGAFTGYITTLLACLRHQPTAMGLLANYLNVTHWAILITFIGAYFHDVFLMPTSLLGVPNMVMSVGSLLGTNIGGRLGDRSGRRPIVITGRLIDATIMALFTTVIDWKLAAFVFLFLLAGPNSAHHMNAQTMMTEMIPHLRGSVMALFTSSLQFGFVSGSLIGGYIVDTSGYTLLGPVAGAIAVLSTIVFWAYVREPGSPTFHPAPAPIGARADGD